MSTYAEEILRFYGTLPRNHFPPNKVEVIFPYDHEETKRVMKAFYTKYYLDSRSRILLFGINPGRFGAGLTGVGFTDPILMQEVCKIQNTLPKTRELSAQFICDTVQAYGSTEAFYSRFLFTTVLPFGLLKEGKNYNYYDDGETLKYFEPLIVESIRKQLSYPNVSKTIVSIGKGKNITYLKKLNRKYNLFECIEALPHPRWVMQYKRGEKELYIRKYKSLLTALCNINR